MRPLELKVFPKPTSPQFTYGGNPYGDQVRRERKVILSKRFTDSELAAEVYSAVFHEAECEVRGMRIERGFPPRPGHPAVEHYVKLNHEFGRQAQILERFATLPHYDEES